MVGSRTAGTLQNTGNSSPEYALRWLAPVEVVLVFCCNKKSHKIQGEAQRRGKGDGAGGRTRGWRFSPSLAKFGDSNGGSGVKLGQPGGGIRVGMRGMSGLLIGSNGASNDAVNSEESKPAFLLCHESCTCTFSWSCSCLCRRRPGRWWPDGLNSAQKRK